MGYLWVVIALALLTGIITTADYLKEVRSLKLDIKPQQSELWAVDMSTALTLVIEKRPSYPRPRVSPTPNPFTPKNVEFRHYRKLYKAAGAARKDAVAGVILSGTPAQPVYRTLVQKLDPRKDALELRMWRDLLIARSIEKNQVRPYLALVDKLDVGPWKDGLRFGIYSAAGDRARADEIWKKLHDRIVRVAVKLGVFVMSAVVVGLVGFILLIIFLVRHFAGLSKLPVLSRVDGNSLIKGFLVYFIGFNMLSAGAALLVELTPFKESGVVRLSAVLCIQFFSCWLGVIVYQASKRAAEEEARWYARQIPQPEPLSEPQAEADTEPNDETPQPVYEPAAEMEPAPVQVPPPPPMLSFRLDSNAVKWGVGGFCAAIILAGLTALVTQLIALVFGVDLVAPEHPIMERMVSGPAAVVLAILTAAVAAPITEEIAFRGLLYGSLRARYGFWGAALISGAVFAIIHPTIPVQFLGLMALGVVFCVLREKTGNLAAPMIAHGINNLVMLIAQLTLLKPW